MKMTDPATNWVSKKTILRRLERMCLIMFSPAWISRICVLRRTRSDRLRRMDSAYECTLAGESGLRVGHCRRNSPSQRGLKAIHHRRTAVGHKSSNLSDSRCVPSGVRPVISISDSLWGGLPARTCSWRSNHEKSSTRSWLRAETDETVARIYLRSGCDHGLGHRCQCGSVQRRLRPSA